MIAAAATPLPTPSPSPVLVQLVNDGAVPPWLALVVAPLLTGAFVLAAARIALKSLEASDRRKLDREDRRQWDNELKAIYVAIAKLIAPVNLELARARSEPDSLGKILDVTSAAMVGISDHLTVLKLIADAPVVEAALKVQHAVSQSYQEALVAQPQDKPNMRWAVDHLMGMSAPMDELRDRVREALRV